MGDASHAISVGMRVRVFPGTDSETLGHVIDDFGDSAGHGVDIAGKRVAQPARRWAVALDDGALLFLDSHQLDAAPQ